MSLTAKEIILYNDFPLIVYCEDGNDKYIANCIKSDDEYDYYVLYPIKDRSEYNEGADWQQFTETHQAKQRVNHTQISWNEALRTGGFI
jgi:hypothetical protein